jgi:type IV pilus biogenesis protein CpaD/CtpE
VSSLRIILLPMICLMLSACTQYWNRYGEREDTVTLSAGDAVASNAAVQIPTPWPRYSNDTTIAMDGERIARAVARYREGEKQPVATVPETPLYGSTFGNANASSQGAGAAAGPPPGQGYGAAPAPGP